MVGIPGIDSTQDYTLVQLINRIYIFLIAAGAVIGVVKIALAGIKYATTDIGGNKSQAKEDIKNVLLGLLILVTPYIVLTAINPGFVKLDILNLHTLSVPQNEGSKSTNELDKFNAQCPGSCPLYADGACNTYIADCRKVPGVEYSTRLQTEPFTLSYFCKVEQGSTCPNGDTPDTQCAAGGTDDCDDCKFSCDPEDSNDQCKSWKAQCENIPGAYVDKPGWYEPGDDWECEIPELENGDEDARSCGLLKSYATDE
jgi:hypothetical protein